MKNGKREAFWKDMLSGANGGISSKRVIGSFILLVMLLVIVAGVFFSPDSAWINEAVVTMLIGAFSLLGIGGVEKRRMNGHDNDESI